MAIHYMRRVRKRRWSLRKAGVFIGTLSILLWAFALYILYYVAFGD